MIIVRLLSPEPVGWLALPTLLGDGSRHCHGINFVSDCFRAMNLRKKLGIALGATAVLVVAVVWLYHSLGAKFVFVGWR
jgi:hypothetical protein